MHSNEKHRYFFEFSDNSQAILSFFDSEKVNLFLGKTIHILELYQKVTKHLFKKMICKPYFFSFFYVDNVDNSVDNFVFVSFSTLFDVDNFFSLSESLVIFFRHFFLIVQTADFLFFFHIFYPHL